jgi:membrane associated rhomboid family serine protease
MLHDRQYMREDYREGPKAWTVLIIALIACYVLQVGATLFFGVPVVRYLGLSWYGIKSLYLWQPLTYQFLHAMPTPIPWHLLGNCLGIYFFGRHIEERYGRNTFILLYLGGALVGAILQVFSVFMPMHQDIPVVGASAGTAALFTAFASLYPEEMMSVFIWFIPITVRAKWLFFFFLGITVFLTVFPVDAGTAHPAHLGGIAFGYAVVRWGWIGEFSGPQWWEWVQDHLPRRKTPKTRPVPAWQTEIIERQKPTPETEFMSRDVDPILEKISTHGIQSLTAKERQVLEAARKRMGKG